MMERKRTTLQVLYTMNQMAIDFRYQLSKRIEENDCLTPRIMRAMLSDKDGDLAETMGDYAMEPFIKKMNSFELLEVFAPKLMTYFTLRSIPLPVYYSLNDLLVDIELYLGSD